MKRGTDKAIPAPAPANDAGRGCLRPPAAPAIQPPLSSAGKGRDAAADRVANRRRRTFAPRAVVISLTRRKRERQAPARETAAGYTPSPLAGEGRDEGNPRQTNAIQGEAMAQTTDWHRNVEYVTGEDLREAPERPSQASGTARHQQQVRQRRIRARRVQQFVRRR